MMDWLSVQRERPRDSWRRVEQQLEPLAAERRFDEDKTSDVAGWRGPARDQAEIDGVGRLDEYDGYRAGCLLQCNGGRGGVGKITSGLSSITSRTELRTRSVLVTSQQ
jgi:hypothetical protein